MDACPSVICGDCVPVMAEFEPNTFDSIVTDPPYGLEFMGKEWDRFAPQRTPNDKRWAGKHTDHDGWEESAAARSGKGGGGPSYAARRSVFKRCKICGRREFSGTPCRCEIPDWDYETPEGAPTQTLAYQEWCRTWAVEALRVAKPGAHLLAFGGTRTWHRLACALEDAGWEIRDTIMWVYGSGFPKSHDISKAIDREAGATPEPTGEYKRASIQRNGAGENWERGAFGSHPEETKRVPVTAPTTPEALRWQGWGTALKPAWEPIIVARKPVNCTVADNVLKWGTGGMNIDACRIETDDALVHGGPLVTNSGDTRTGKALGMFQPGTPNTYEQHPSGRWPANLIHDGSDEVVRGFPQSNGELHNKPASSIFGGAASGGARSQSVKDSGSAARFFYCAKASKQDRDEGCEGMPYHTAGECTDREEGTAGLESPRAGAGRTNGSRNHHPTVKPTALMRYLCKLVTPPGGIVLDPFCGSGSTLKAAILEGFDCVGIDKDAEYCEIARARTAKAREQMRMAL